MIRRFTIVFIVAYATIFSCTNSKQEKEPGVREEAKNGIIVSEADKIVYRFGASSVAPQYHRSYSIAVTENNLHLAINSYGDTLLTKDWTFTKEKFEQVKDRLKNLKQEGSIDESEIPNGGTSQSISLYKKEEEIFSGEDYRRTKNFSGADIDLSYLIPEIKELIESTKTKTQEN